MPTEPNPKAANSGAVISPDGERHIPSSTRADGSVRKEIRIRPGYRPPEDVELYKSRTAEAWKNRGKGGVPGAESIVPKPQTSSSSANKNAKRREARKKAAATGTPADEANGKEATEQKDETTEKAASKSTEAGAPKDPEAEDEKEAKKLTKKLRQARELKDKKEKGDALLPEQFEKVIKINELIRQLDNLGFDSNGEKKQHDAT
ncbi:RNA binding protein Pym [Phyllosticta citribraziliensis]|uniref:RNA binding protein Pym n=1 Tax=Phyllosticta citribraziliensis TaxID=989973 RepID=A0ABR1LDD1_9PEZI